MAITISSRSLWRMVALTVEGGHGDFLYLHRAINVCAVCLPYLQWRVSCALLPTGVLSQAGEETGREGISWRVQA